ncbi:putative PKS-like protein biosynthetic cluster [Diaporthe eres]|uniref:PKS-like protein biosynthetic cluster n=1 Tax=Diaporthe eres TaxID=83184 RepID=A0ABR1NTL3_DIAER
MGSYSKSPPYEDGLEDPVVIVGLSFRFPSDAVSEESFWEILRDGHSTMTEVPASRYNINGHYSDASGRQHGVTARGGHFIKGDISAFDAPFFKMSAAEAKAMDPQLRILLETTYHAFESANLSLDDVAGSNTSVYVGSLSQEYDSLFAFDEEIDAKYQAIGTSSSMLSNRPAQAALLDSILAARVYYKESLICLVGGVQLQLEPRKMTAAVSRLGFLSPDSQCYSFDDRANGYSRGEGVAMLVLKRLSRALEDGDTIRAVIRGTATNQDGRTPSITQPSPTAQAALIQRTYQMAGLDFKDTGYFEAHGTGTAVGDPIEASGISQAFTRYRDPRNPLYVGSVKANIGHLESSAGLAGLIKTVLVLEKGVIPPNALLKNLNPKILADKWHLNGAQWASMGVELLAFAVFRESVEYADAYLRSIGSTWSALALVDLLSSWNIHPQAVVGHSSGEIAAACCAGSLSRDSALRVAYFRGECVSKLLEDSSTRELGGMLAVGLSAEELQPHIQAVLGDGDPDELQCGCLNSPKSTTVTGLDRYIDALAGRLEELKVFSRKLNVPVAYHSRQMLAVADSYRSSLEGYLKPGAKGRSSGTPALFSSVTGFKAPKDDLSSADYWVKNLVSPVRFSQALQLMYTSLQDGEDSQTRPLTYLVEVGPHCSLERPIRDTLPGDSALVYDYTLRRNSSSVDDVKRLAGRTAIHGYAVDVQALNGHLGRPREPKVLFDLPKYSFNHSQSYWVESRLSRNTRNREHPRHELLGTRSADWNPLRPTWRLVLRDSDLPWVADHKVDGIILYPAAGMLVMAIEGLRSLQTESSRVSGYTLKDVNIGSALVVPTGDEGVETQLHLGPCNPTSDTQKGVSAWFFWIHSVTNDEWKLHCSGQISVEENATDDTVSETEGGHAHGTTARSFGKVLERCSSSIDRKAFYQAVLEKSVDLGQTFRTLQDIRFNEGGREATANLPFGDWRQQVRDTKLSEHLIHPTTLDGLLHIPFASIFPKLPVIPSVVPRQINEIYISSDLLSDAARDTLRLYGNTTELGVFHINADVAAVGSSSEKPLVYLRGVKLLGFHATDQRGTASSGPTSLFHRFEWKPDVSLLSQDGIEEYCLEHTARQGAGATSGFDGETERICRYFLSAMLEELDATASEQGSRISSKPSIQNYVKWARTFLDSESQSTASLQEAYPGFEDDDLRPALIEKFASKSVQNRDTVDYGRKLVQIVREEVDALALLFNEGLAERLYQSPTFSLTSHRLASYMDLVAHKNSDLKILEVGAGTGSTTTAVLDVLSQPSLQAPRFSHYDFTDISPSFFADAQDRYSAHSGRMGFKVFDVERDPEEQGFEPGSYDVVIAAATASATEKTRTSGPLLTEPEWNEALLRADFDGLHVSLQDDAEGNHVNSLLVSHARHPSDSTSKRTDVSTVIVTGKKEHEGLAGRLQAHLRSRSKGLCDIIHADKLSKAGTAYDQCICLMELGNPIMAHLDETRFEALRRVTIVATQIIWVTEGCGVGAQNPEASIVAGFAKVLERERPGLSFVHLNVQDGEHAEETILRIVNQSHTLSPEEQETDLVEEDGRILVPRAVEAPDVNRLLDSEKHGLQPRPTDVSNDSTAPGEPPLELRFSPGRLQSVHFGPDTSSPPDALRDDEVRVLTRATGINFRDVMVALNQISDDQIGAEFAGVVVEAGASWRSSFRPGDRVCGPLDGSFRTLVRAPGRNLVRIPPGLSFAEAASIPVAYATAQYALRYLARIQPGESILIHAAAGGVGQAAVNLAQRAGATVYATVSTPEKKKILMERFGIEASHIFSSRHTLFASQIMQRTGGRGVDVVLNSLAGHALTESWRCLAHLGRFVEIGKRDIRAFNRLPMEPFSRNVSFSSLDLKVLADHNPALLSTVMKEIEELVWDETARPHLVPYPLTVFKRSGFEEAFRLLQSGRHSGKVVVDWEQADTIKVVPKSPLDYSFDPNATYVITGGLGGIGRNLAGWMARNGARNLCLLSRSGPVTAASKDLVTALEQDGVHLYTPACDISDAQAVTNVVAHIESHMPPIKGCIHSAMAIENRVFENYDLPTFNSAFPAKVQGTYNLHNHLPRGMEFFVILGSIAAFIGPASQSNYAGVSSFQDAFARFRRARGEHCVTVDLGVVEGIGYIAERVAVARNVDMMFVDHKVLRESDVHFTLKWACNPRLSAPPADGSPWAAQVVAALTTPAFVRRGGVLRDHKWMRIPMFRHLYRMELQQGDGATAGGDDGDNSDSGENAGALLREARTQAEAAAAVTHLFARRLARSLAVPVADIDVGRPAYAFGVDSLVAVELLFWFSSEIRADVPVVQILGSSTIAQLGAVAAAKSEHLLGRDLAA